LSFSFFTPLKKSWGLSLSEICHEQNCKFIIWGSGVLGKKIAHKFIKEGKKEFIFGFYDSAAYGERVVVGNHYFPLIGADLALSKRKLNSLNVRLILASELAQSSMETVCIERGMEKNIDYISYRAINRPEAVINIGSEYLLTEGSERPKSSINMVQSDFKRLTKFLEDVPGLFGIELGGNTDASTCLFIEEAIIKCERIAPTSVIFFSLEWGCAKKILEAKPLQAVLVLDPNSLKSLDLPAFSLLIQKIAELKSPTEFRVRIDLYRSTAPDLIIEIGKICEHNQIKVVKTTGYGFAYDALYNDNLSAIRRELVWNLDGALNEAYVDRKKPCLCQRMFPVIDKNLDIQTCHVYKNQPIGNLKTLEGYADALEMRDKSQACLTCQSRGFHRLDVHVLGSRIRIKKGLE
jgi:hypothetical protein